MARRNKKIKYNEHLDRCSGVCCPMKQWCYRYALDAYYNDPTLCKNPPKVSWWVDPKYNGNTCENYLEIEYK